MSVDPAATPPVPPSEPVADPARPAATAADQPPAPGDSAVSPDVAHPAEATQPQGAPYTIDTPAPAEAVEGVTDEGGYSSSRPLLMVGAAGPEVAELAFLLAKAGYSNAIVEGKADAPPTLDDALMADVVEFQAANGIDPWASDGPNAPIIRRDHSGVVDARTWEALLGYKPVQTRAGSEVLA